MPPVGYKIAEGKFPAVRQLFLKTEHHKYLQGTYKTQQDAFCVCGKDFEYKHAAYVCIQNLASCVAQPSVLARQEQKIKGMPER